MKDIKSGPVKGRPFILRVPKFPADNLLPSWAALLWWQVLTQRSQLLFCEGQDLNPQLGLMNWSVPKGGYQSYQCTIFLRQFWGFTCPWWFGELVMPKKYLSLVYFRPQRVEKLSWRVAWVDGSAFPSVFLISRRVFYSMKCHKYNKSTLLSFFPFSFTLLPFLGNIFSSFSAQY